MNKFALTIVALGALGAGLPVLAQTAEAPAAPAAAPVRIASSGERPQTFAA